MTALKPQYDGVGAGQDVSEMLVEAGVVGLWRYDLSQNLVTGDVAMAQTYNLDPDQVRSGLRPDHYRAAIHPHDMHGAVDALNQAIRCNTDYLARYRLQDPEGRWRMVSVRGRPHRSAEERITHFAGINQLAEDDGDVDDHNRMALLAAELLHLTSRAGDDRAYRLAQSLLMQVSHGIAKRLSGAQG